MRQKLDKQTNTIADTQKMLDNQNEFIDELTAEVKKLMKEKLELEKKNIELRKGRTNFSEN